MEDIVSLFHGFAVVLQPGGSLWEVAPSYEHGRVPDGQLKATGTSGETLTCEEVYF